MACPAWHFAAERVQLRWAEVRRRSATMKARWWLGMLLAALLGASAVAHACDSYAPGGGPAGSGDAAQGKSGG